MNNNLAAFIEDTIKNYEETKNLNSFQFEKNKLYAYLGSLVDSLKKYKAFIAGGTITSLFTNGVINDLDIYFRDEKSIIGFVDEHWEDSNSWVTGLTKKSVLIQSKDGDEIRNVQLIHFKYFNSAKEIFDTFDFTVCMGAFDFSTEQFILHDDFMKHNSQRILKFNKNTAFPIVSLLRVQKYNKKNYSISKPEFLRIVLRCMDLDINTVEEVKNHLGGMYGINYDKIINFEEGEEFTIDKVIDKISDLALDEDYFKTPLVVKFEDVDDIIDTIKKQPIHMLSVNNKYYRISHNSTLKEMSAKAPFFIEVDKGKFFSTKRFYKFVDKVSDGLYRSHFRNSFKYEDGKVSTATGDKLYFNEKQNISSSTYYNRGVLIEVSTDPDDLLGKNSNDVYLKSCLVLREVPKSEWESWNCEEKIEENSESDDPFEQQ